MGLISRRIFAIILVLIVSSLANAQISAIFNELTENLQKLKSHHPETKELEVPIYNPRVVAKELRDRNLVEAGKVNSPEDEIFAHAMLLKLPQFLMALESAFTMLQDEPEEERRHVSLLHRKFVRSILTKVCRDRFHRRLKELAEETIACAPDATKKAVRSTISLYTDQPLWESSAADFAKQISAARVRARIHIGLSNNSAVQFALIKFLHGAREELLHSEEDIKVQMLTRSPKIVMASKAGKWILAEAYLMKLIARNDYIIPESFHEAYSDLIAGCAIDGAAKLRDMEFVEELILTLDSRRLPAPTHLLTMLRLTDELVSHNSLLYRIMGTPVKLTSTQKSQADLLITDFYDCTSKLAMELCNIYCALTETDTTEENGRGAHARKNKKNRKRKKQKKVEKDVNVYGDKEIGERNDQHNNKIETKMRLLAIEDDASQLHGMESVAPTKTVAPTPTGTVYVAMYSSYAAKPTCATATPVVHLASSTYTARPAATPSRLAYTRVPNPFEDSSDEGSVDSHRKTGDPRNAQPSRAQHGAMTLSALQPQRPGSTRHIENVATSNAYTHAGASRTVVYPFMTPSPSVRPVNTPHLNSNRGDELIFQMEDLHVGEKCNAPVKEEPKSLAVPIPQQLFRSPPSPLHNQLTDSSSGLTGFESRFIGNRKRANTGSRVPDRGRSTRTEPETIICADGRKIIRGFAAPQRFSRLEPLQSSAHSLGVTNSEAIEYARQVREEKSEPQIPTGVSRSTQPRFIGLPPWTINTNSVRSGVQGAKSASGLLETRTCVPKNSPVGFKSELMPPNYNDPK